MKKVIIAVMLVALTMPLVAQTVSIKRSNISVQEAIALLSHSSNYSVTVSSGQLDLNRKVDISASGASIEVVLDQIFVGQDVEYKIEGNTIFVSRRQAKSTPAPQPVFRGRVVGAEGEPLPGAYIRIASKDGGFVCDVAGYFELSGVKFPATLVASFIGYDTTTVSVSGDEVQPFIITMKDSSNFLDDVVVVGYGTQARKTLTTSISKVDGDALMNAPVSSVGEAVKGKVTGLRIATSNTLSGEAPRFLIRGGSSVSMSNDPIYLVDGAVRDDLNGINPNDIESLEVLKDAASAAIYGARASNGVILITTRKGSKSKGPMVVFDVQMGVQTPASRWDILSAREYLQFIRPAISTALAQDTQHPASTLLNGPNAYGTGNTSPTSIFSTRYLDYKAPVPEGYQWMYDPVDPTKVLIFTDTDWQSQWFSPAFWQKEYVGVNGGNDQMKYAASIGYLQDDGVVAMSNYNVFTMHGNTSFKVTPRLEAGATFGLSRQTKHIPNDNYYQPIGRGLIAPRTAMEKNARGEWNQLVLTNVNSHSPAWYETFYDRMNTTNRVSGTFNLRWDIIEGLAAHAQYNYYEQNYVGSYYAYGERDGTGNSVSTTRSTTETRTSMTRDTFTAHLNFNRSFGDHHISATGGYEYMKQHYLYLTSNATGATSDDVPVLQSGINFTTSNNDQTQVMISYFGRAGYDFKQRYIFSATIRADASSKFAKGNQWGFFPSASAAWIVSEEPFWDSLRRSVNTLKLRASFGQTGNNGIGLYDTYGSFVTGVYAGLSTFDPGAMQNAGMKWETTTQLDIGLDIGIARDRVRVILDYYNKVTDNMLYSITLPDTSPYSSVKANVGGARFYGFEVELHSANIQKRNFSWSTDFTYSFNANRVLSLPDEYIYDEVDEFGNLTGRKAWRIGGYTMSETGYRFGGTAVGEPLGRIYGYKIDHIIQSLSDADAALWDNESFGYRVSDGQRIKGRKDAGDYEWQNRVGSARDENSNEIINSEDMFYLGNVMPHSTGGIGNNFSFGRFNLNIYFDYAIGHSIINGQKTQMLKNTMGDCNSILGRMVYDCWKYPGDTSAKYARYTPNDSDWGNRNWRGNSDFMVERADYLCLRDVTFSYNLPEKWIQPLHMKQLTLSISGNTLYYFTGVTGAISPETGMSSSSGASMYTAVSTNNSSSDIRGNLMPSTRKLIFSIKATF